jgi:hypothetical protein
MTFVLLWCEVGAVLFVLVAEIFENVGIRLKLESDFDRKGFGVHLGIVERHFYIHMSEVAATVALHYPQGFAMGVAKIPSSAVLSLKPVVSTTSVSPSQCPME